MLRDTLFVSLDQRLKGCVAINHVKGNNFGWLFGRKNYDFFATILGYGDTYYTRIAKALPLENGMYVLDMGCGTESVGIAVSRQLGEMWKSMDWICQVSSLIMQLQKYLNQVLF